MKSSRSYIHSFNISEKTIDININIIIIIKTVFILYLYVMLSHIIYLNINT